MCLHLPTLLPGQLNGGLPQGLKPSTFVIFLSSHTLHSLPFGEVHSQIPPDCPFTTSSKTVPPPLKGSILLLLKQVLSLLSLYFHVSPWSWVIYFQNKSQSSPPVPSQKFPDISEVPQLGLCDCLLTSLSNYRSFALGTDKAARVHLCSYLLPAKWCSVALWHQSKHLCPGFTPSCCEPNFPLQPYFSPLLPGSTLLMSGTLALSCPWPSSLHLQQMLSSSSVLQEPSQTSVQTKSFSDLAQMTETLVPQGLTLVTEQPELRVRGLCSSCIPSPLRHSWQPLSITDIK